MDLCISTLIAGVAKIEKNDESSTPRNDAQVAGLCLGLNFLLDSSSCNIGGLYHCATTFYSTLQAAMLGDYITVPQYLRRGIPTAFLASKTRSDRDH